MRRTSPPIWIALVGPCNRRGPAHVRLFRVLAVGAWRAPSQGCPRMAGAPVPGARELDQDGRDSVPHRVQGFTSGKADDRPRPQQQPLALHVVSVRWQLRAALAFRVRVFQPYMEAGRLRAQRGGAWCGRAVIRSQCPGNPLPPGLRSMHLASYRSDVSTRYIVATGRHMICRRRWRQPDVQRAVV
jgi:hypothetical protein